MQAGDDLLLEAAASRFTHDDGSRFGCGNRLYLRHVEITLGPRSNDVGDIGGVFASREKMIGAVERNETLWVLGGGEDVAGVLDPYHLVGGRMEDEQRATQRANAWRQVLLGNVVQKRASNAKRPAGERDLDLALRRDLRQPLLEQAGDVTGIIRRGDRHHRACFRHARRRSKYGGAAKTVADQDRGRAPGSPQLVGRCNDVIDIG